MERNGLGRSIAMNTLQNLHQHPTFCDGKDTPEDGLLVRRGKEFLRNCGYTERHILAKEGFIPVPL